MKMKYAVCLAAITMAAFSACADPMRGFAGLFCPEDHFEWEVIDGAAAVKITGYVGGRTDVRIPPYIQGLPVTVIGELAFLGGERQYPPIGQEIIPRHSIASIIIPYGITHIKFSAFAHNNITNVTIPGSVIYIGTNAFGWNYQLRSVTIQEGTTHIGVGAFNHNHIYSVTIPNSVTIIETVAFMDNQLTSVVIPNYNAYVSEWAFDQGVTVKIGTGE